MEVYVLQKLSTFFEKEFELVDNSGFRLYHIVKESPWSASYRISAKDGSCIGYVRYKSHFLSGCVSVDLLDGPHFHLTFKGNTIESKGIDVEIVASKFLFDIEVRNFGQILMTAKCQGRGLKPYHKLEIAENFDPLVAMTINLAVHLQRQMMASSTGIS